LEDGVVGFGEDIAELVSEVFQGVGGRVLGIVDVDSLMGKGISGEIEIDGRFCDKRPIEGDVGLDEKDAARMRGERRDAEGGCSDGGSRYLVCGKEGAQNKALNAKKLLGGTRF